MIHGRSQDLLSLLINQVMFFMLCERWFCPAERLTGLYSLLFYNIMGYVVSYATQLISLHKYSPIVRVSEHTNLRHLALTATKVVLDLTKAVTFVITGVFMLLVFGLEQGLEHFNPTWAYIFFTVIYYVLTEKTCQEKFPPILSWIQIEYLEGFEILWAPIISCLLTSLASGIMITLVWFGTTGGWIVVFGASYANVFLTLREMETHWKILAKEHRVIKKYRSATKQELKDWDDDCPVCLQSMKCARITPCNHFFHGACLRQCIKQGMDCPLCKQVL